MSKIKKVYDNIDVLERSLDDLQTLVGDALAELEEIKNCVEDLEEDELEEEILKKDE